MTCTALSHTGVNGTNIVCIALHTNRQQSTVLRHIVCHQGRIQKLLVRHGVQGHSRKWGGPGTESLVGVQRVNTFTYLTFNFVCNFCTRTQWICKKTVGMLYIQMTGGMHLPTPTPNLHPQDPSMSAAQRKRVVNHTVTVSQRRQSCILCLLNWSLFSSGRDYHTTAQRYQINEMLQAACQLSRT